MILSMTRAVECAQRCAFCMEQLAILDIQLRGNRLVLVNARSWAEFKKTPDPSSMVIMIMGDDCVGNGGILRGENGRECLGP